MIAERQADAERHGSAATPEAAARIGRRLVSCMVGGKLRRDADSAVGVRRQRIVKNFAVGDQRMTDDL